MQGAVAALQSRQGTCQTTIKDMALKALEALKACFKPWGLVSPGAAFRLKALVYNCCYGIEGPWGILHYSTRVKLFFWCPCIYVL